MPTNSSNPGNFANRSKEEVKAIASKGGKAGSEHKGFASQKYDDQKHREVASKGGKASSGSFRPGDERAREAGRKGGKASNRSSNGGGNNGTADYDEDDDDGE
ncbi:Conidiation-specific protein 10 [Endocarpon pusillum Z07020]|uniref:Conidiation-specific protein 10 n=1 Tax=Endocarpon pusillum (strain Z07020 / HMAS-L-300199) TaxID=1263415 RepID=U1HKS4_ENDPU|nr:Conidiation-specific protein 10 [Endocarpon pusillum Z07020]ERF70855.1 Conidiation-specific protein 10 [Endocarpon pusillum Z07020]